MLVVAEGNKAVIKIIKGARSMALRHLPRTHLHRSPLAIRGVLKPSDLHAVRQHKTADSKLDDEGIGQPTDLGTSVGHCLLEAESVRKPACQSLRF